MGQKNHYVLSKSLLDQQNLTFQMTISGRVVKSCEASEPSTYSDDHFKANTFKCEQFYSLPFDKNMLHF